MSKKARGELAAAVRQRYREADRPQKSKVLDERHSDGRLISRLRNPEDVTIRLPYECGSVTRWLRSLAAVAPSWPGVSRSKARPPALGTTTQQCDESTVGSTKPWMSSFGCGKYNTGGVVNPYGGWRPPSPPPANHRRDLLPEIRDSSLENKLPQPPFHVHHSAAAVRSPWFLWY